MGVGAAVAAVGVAGVPPGGAPVEQPQLFTLKGAPVESGAAKEARARGAGRPPGARNKRTREWAEYIQRRYGDPREALAAIMVTPIEQLARELGCKRVEAFAEWRACVRELLPYVAQKLPIEVDFTGKLAVLNISMGDGTQPGALAGGDLVAALFQAAAGAAAGEDPAEDLDESGEHAESST